MPTTRSTPVSTIFANCYSFPITKGCLFCYPGDVYPSVTALTDENLSTQTHDSNDSSDYQFMCKKSHVMIFVF